jgi:hypothetical protein
MPIVMMGARKSALGNLSSYSPVAGMKAGYVGGEARARASILLKHKKLLPAKSAKKGARRSLKKSVCELGFQLPIEAAGFNRQLEVGDCNFRHRFFP